MGQLQTVVRKIEMAEEEEEKKKKKKSKSENACRRFDYRWCTGLSQSTRKKKREKWKKDEPGRTS